METGVSVHTWLEDQSLWGLPVVRGSEAQAKDVNFLSLFGLS